MTKPEYIHFNKLKLMERRKISNGVIYEHWHDAIDNEHHLHFPDGTFVCFGHEDGEGSVEISETELG